MEAFVKWLVANLVLLISCLINGAILMWIMNSVFSLTVGFWGWFGVAFAVTEIVSSGVALQKITK